ncbi:uncharacterized protein LOC143592869 [Bidens hawaiensis]|uniref:uncharacterized protein LOC143592869 n=1 Tax=Bidens hawaiensis TaxID=980011 RepID=UPI00404A5813
MATQTRNQSVEQRIGDHDAALQRLEATAGMNINQLSTLNLEIDSVKNQLNQQSAQMAAQMAEVLATLQELKANQTNNNDGQHQVTLCDEYAVSLFLNALKPEIGNPLKLLRPRTLPEAYMLARQQTDNLKLLPNSSYKTSYKPSYKPVDSYPKSVYNHVPISSANLPLLPAPPYKPRTTRTLSTKEIADKRARGECFGCTEKYSATHQCKNKQLFSIEVWEVEEESGEPVLQEFLDPQISLNAIMGVSLYSTMKVTGSTCTKPLHILIDSGSTHNFLDEKIAYKMRCPTKEMPSMKITIADGNVMSCTKVCENVQWMMQGKWFKTNVLLIPLTNYDMVLGIQWLQSLDDITWNFKDLTMKFKGKSDVSQINTLLEKYDQVFALPTSLTPKKSCDYQIILKEGIGVIAQKPYRYPAVQKDIIEKMTQELLDMGIARESTSPFASPVVLVKKKDGSWRMCVDYRKLNEAIVKNNFPIPLIDELLDELAGATVFSMLDLSIARPLTNLLKKDAFYWTKEAQLAFEQLKVALTTATVLALPDFSKVFIIETDASAKGLGAVLMQENHPLTFISKGISVKQQAMSVYEKELLAS